MEPNPQSPKKILEQILANSEALCLADLKLKQLNQRTAQQVEASHQLIGHSARLRARSAQLRARVTPSDDQLNQSFEKGLAFSQRMERLGWLLLLLGSGLGFGGLAHLLFPHWLPEQWAAFVSFIQQL